MSDNGIDPRYRPEFQRGYSAQTPEAAPAPVRRAERISPPPVAPPQHQQATADAPVSERRSVRPSLGDAHGTDWQHEDFDDEVDEYFEEEPEPSIWRNPFIIVLIIIGVVLTAVGIGLFRWSVDQSYNTQYGFVEGEDAQANWVAIQTTWALSPLLVVAGIVALICVAYFAATHWRPRRRGADEFAEG